MPNTHPTPSLNLEATSPKETAPPVPLAKASAKARAEASGSLPRKGAQVTSTVRGKFAFGKVSKEGARLETNRAKKRVEAEGRAREAFNKEYGQSSPSGEAQIDHTTEVVSQSEPFGSGPSSLLEPSASVASSEPWAPAPLDPLGPWALGPVSGVSPACSSVPRPLLNQNNLDGKAPTACQGSKQPCATCTVVTTLYQSTVSASASQGSAPARSTNSSKRKRSWQDNGARVSKVKCSTPSANFPAIFARSPRLAARFPLLANPKDSAPC